MDLIYCAKYTELSPIAASMGFLLGARSDSARVIKYKGMIDINWKNYNWDNHLSVVKDHQPKYSVAPDITNREQLNKTINNAYELKKWSDFVIVVPKENNLINDIPNDFVIGVSVPSNYAGFVPMGAELSGRKAHLLGGSPRKQLELYRHYSEFDVEIASSDINCHHKASNYGSYWNGNKWCDNERSSIGKHGAFKKSCEGIIRMWGHELNREKRHC